MHSYLNKIFPFVLLCSTISIFVFNKLKYVKAHFLSSFFLNGFAIRRDNAAKKN